VYWFLLPSIILLLGIEHFYKALNINFITAILLNSGIIFSVLLLLYLYTILVIKKPFLKEVFGLADALFFLALAVAFPTATFLIIFVFSLFFSILTWLILKSRTTYNTVPLAGYMSIFLIFVLVGNWVSPSLNLYLI